MYYLQKFLLWEISQRKGESVLKSRTLCYLVWWCQEMLLKYFSVIVLNSPSSMVITQNKKKILVSHRKFWHIQTKKIVRVSQKRYSTVPEESPCFFVYSQSHHWLTLAYHGRHHSESQKYLQITLCFAVKSLSCHEKHRAEKPNRLTLFFMNQRHVIF